MFKCIKLFSCYLLLCSTHGFACGPSPQKVVEKVVIKANPEAVWAVIGEFKSIHRWHPDVVNTSVQSQVNTEGKETQFRTLTLKNGGQLVARLRETQQGEMKLGTVMESGDMAVSSYSDALTVKQSTNNDETEIIWTGRFNNLANLLIAPEGQDNKAAIAAVQQFYQRGLTGLKAYVEAIAK